MNLQQDDNKATYQIRRYEPGCIWINEASYQSSVIIRPHELITPWAPKTLVDLTFSHFERLLTNAPDILILGTGQHLVIPQQSLLAPLFEKGIGVEFMDSRAACFTYMALAAEERNVAACILII